MVRFVPPIHYAQVDLFKYRGISVTLKIQLAFAYIQYILGFLGHVRRVDVKDVGFQPLKCHGTVPLVHAHKLAGMLVAYRLGLEINRRPPSEATTILGISDLFDNELSNSLIQSDGARRVVETAVYVGNGIGVGTPNRVVRAVANMLVVTSSPVEFTIALAVCALVGLAGACLGVAATTGDFA